MFRPRSVFLSNAEHGGGLPRRRRVSFGQRPDMEMRPAGEVRALDTFRRRRIITQRTQSPVPARRRRIITQRTQSPVPPGRW